MRSVVILGFAITSLRRARLQTALTTLGVVIGVASVVAMVSIGDGARALIEATLARPESQILNLRALSKSLDWQTGNSTLASDDRLTILDYRTLRSRVTDVVAISPRLYLASPVRAGGKTSQSVTEGIDTEGFVMMFRRVSDGASFGSVDIDRAAAVCVVTEDFAEYHFPGRSAVGSLVRVNDTPLSIVGVVTAGPVDEPSARSGQDLQVFVPFTSFLQRLDRSAELAITAQARSPEVVTRVRNDILSVMEEVRGRRRSEFKLVTRTDSIKAYAAGSEAMIKLLAAVSAISLAVGGIGIMNIMLANIAGRTREIGVRMAVGTRRSDILRQFLVESVTLSLFGGVIGMVLGIGVSYLVTQANGWPTRITALSVLVAIVSSTAVGIAFGYQPALRASRLAPSEALRS